MRYMMLYKPGRETHAPPTEKEIAAMGELPRSSAGRPHRRNDGAGHLHERMKMV